MNTKKLFARDNNLRKNLKKPTTAFISPSLPKPKTYAEKAVRKILEDKNLLRVYMVHIYNVHRLMELAYNVGKMTSKKIKSKR